MDVGLNVYSFAVRTPGRPAQKYQLKAYDESILAPMVMFEPRVIDFDRKELRSSAFLSRGVEEDIQEIPGERMVCRRPAAWSTFAHILQSAAIAISTDHLLRMQEMAPAVPILQEVPDVEGRIHLHPKASR
jgi:actin-related protein 8